MEAHWSRANNHIALSLGKINDLINPISDAAVSFEFLGEGKANTNLKLQLRSGKQCALRLYQRDPECQTLETAIYKLLSDQIPVPKVIFEDRVRAFCILDWIPGQTLQSVVLGKEPGDLTISFRELGEILSRIGAVEFESAGFLGVNETSIVVREKWESIVSGFKDYLEFLLKSQNVKDRTSNKLIFRITEAWRQNQQLLAELACSPNLVHGDFKASNILVTDGHVTAILDWEFAHSGTSLLDIGQLFRHNQTRVKSLIEAFEIGFLSSGKRLPENWLKAAGLIDILSLVEFLSREATTPQMVEEITTLILRNLEA